MDRVRRVEVNEVDLAVAAGLSIVAARIVLPAAVDLLGADQQIGDSIAVEVEVAGDRDAGVVVSGFPEVDDVGAGDRAGQALRSATLATTSIPTS